MFAQVKPKSLGGTPPYRVLYVLVTGGTGRLGRQIVSRDGAASITWRILSRRDHVNEPIEYSRGDLLTGQGLSSALAGMHTVLHLASNPRSPREDLTGTQKLVAAATKAEIKHLVYVSIIGVDRIPYSYYQAKLAAEQTIMTGRTPWTVLRVAQFHSFVDWLLTRALRFPGILPVPAGFKVQSVADVEVADRLIQVLQQAPAGRLRDFAGPEILSASSAARTWVKLRHRRRPVVAVPIPGAVARAFRSGANTAEDSDRGLITWRQWIENVPPSAT